ncbi:right-handed parallel beta-helix repeat-containing protein [Pararobbsia alpina]|uniref:right-handed parallel beta-helix repeat-containing protein n=1 Tax=Pararobbsia alpina TaxID=621374 RepID=UPI0039A4C3AD
MKRTFRGASVVPGFTKAAAALAFALLGCATAQATTVNVTAAATNAEESGATAAPATVNLSASAVALRDALSVLSANKAKAGSGISSLNIVLGSGTYQIASTLTVTVDPTWSGVPVTISGPADGSAIITGSKVVTGFTAVTDSNALSRLPTAAHGSVVVASLAANGVTNLGTFNRHGYGISVTPAPLEVFFRDQPMTVARWPNTGFATIASLPGGPTGLSFTVSGGNPTAWAKEPNLRAFGYWARDWADTTLPVQSVDGSGTLTLQSPAPTMGLAVGQRVVIENALSELDSPGEYYVDQTAGLLYFWPPATMSTGDVQVSVANSLLVFNSATNLLVQYLTLDIGRGDGIQLNGGGKNTVDHVTIRNMGNRGGVSSAGSSGFQYVTMANTGEGGITIYSGNRTTLAAGSSFVTNSTIHDYARLSRAYRPAISLSGAGDQITGNTIYNGPHAAIIFGGNNHEISNNEIYNVVTETSDSGAIYAGRDWTMRGTIIESNFLHDIGSTSQPTATMGVYLDDEYCQTTVRRNVFSNVMQPVFVGGGRDNVISDNLFVNSSPAVSADSRGMSWQKADVTSASGVFQTALRAVPYNTAPYSTQYPNLPSILTNLPGVPLNNVITRNVVIGGTQLTADSGAAQYLQIGTWFGPQDVVFSGSSSASTASVTSGSTTSQYGSFVLSPSSPAIAQGFQPSQFSR